ncbi:Hypothetical predicted protein [Octopus vulgaris]|uniref:Uncharacterized protein n=1 Tax=Octopus vulgaris TaxID=6645 RepID=A0AA36B0G2_OCTVU|nr:Hypothetical predicted protein [Octopus vulgaris]
MYSKVLRIQLFIIDFTEFPVLNNCVGEILREGERSSICEDFLLIVQGERIKSVYRSFKKRERKKEKEKKEKENKKQIISEKNLVSRTNGKLSEINLEEEWYK